MTPRHSPRPFAAAFTLVELLVTIAVLALLVIVVAQLMNQTTIATSLSNKRLDSDADARVVFTRLMDDIDQMVLRSNIDCFFVKNTGGAKNDSMYFYAQSPASVLGDLSQNAGVYSSYAFVGYKIANRGGAATTLYPDKMLERTGIRVKYNDGGTSSMNSSWNLVSLVRPLATGTGAAPLPVPETTLPHSSSQGFNIGSGPNWDNSVGNSTFYGRLSPQVFRFEFCFQLKDGKYYAPPPPGNTPWLSAPFCDAMLKIRTDATALIVTIALLDTTSRVLVPDLSRAVNALADGDDPKVAKLWTDKINSPNFAVETGMPVTAASQVRVYQRSFRLPAR